MRNYRIYLIEDEFAHHYYGREKLFFNLFLEYINSSGKQKGILQKQIEYITKPVPIEALVNILEIQSLKKKDFTCKDGVYYLEKSHGRSRAALKLDREYMVLQAKGDFEAETSFFECIRKYDSDFLAMDLENNRYGWLQPIKERKFV
ncbi:sporulation inhibitor of replication protein SirA [Bacillus sp. CECT 9360]|uniref:sporulation inhibitor of replication protein SirA n=1 Tax=Bacillus sp. CECT 9360 TaxID=2845821 RepID=UPI001E3EEC6B|nr:sporulation inhibitor of replication protein SirA [Bacillus sp. CECT 9360]CAH0346067.1 Sporulation inhibitor of replication protein SirA [Bacillus sp. CECT 9360]